MSMQATCLQHMALLFSGVGSGVTQCTRVNERDGGDDVVKGLSTKLLNASRVTFGSAAPVQPIDNPGFNIIILW
jgi:hypothetical protein